MSILVNNITISDVREYFLKTTRQSISALVGGSDGSAYEKGFDYSHMPHRFVLIDHGFMAVPSVVNGKSWKCRFVQQIFIFLD